MNASILQEAEKQVLHSAFASAEAPAGGINRFDFRMAVRHKCLEPGRYLMLMREHYGKGNSRRSGGLRLRSDW